MKILTVSQNYYPEHFRVTEICEGLVKAGHDVTVLTGRPCCHFEGGKIPKEYRNGHLNEVVNGVKIIRVKQYARRTGNINRVINYYSYANKSKAAVKRLDSDFDAVFVYGLTPVMSAAAAVEYKKRYGAPIVFYCLDLWPASLTAGGIRENSLIYSHYRKVSKKMYAAADVMCVSSENFSDYFESEFGFNSNNAVYLPQYAEETDSADCVKIPDGNTDLLFAGNIGAAQSVKTIIEAADLLRDKPRIKIHIAGDGTEYENCKRLAESLGLTNVTFYGNRPKTEMPELYSRADATIVTLSANKLLEKTLPAKVQGYMAAKKPIIGAVGGETYRVLCGADCGFCGGAEDAKTLAENILKFDSLSDEQKRALAENSENYYKSHFSKDGFFKTLLAAFDRAIERK